MSRLPIPHFIQEIKTKLGFDRTMTASGDDVVDAVNKQSRQIEELETGLNASNITRVLSLNNGSPYNNYGGVFYRKIGCFVVVHIGVQGLTANTRNGLFTLPEGYMPLAGLSFVCGAGSANTRALCSIYSYGLVEVISDDGYAYGEIVFVAKQ